MANGKKTGGRDFAPGQSGNPAGRPGIPAALRAQKQAFKVRFEQTVLRLVDLSFEKLQDLVKDPSTPSFDAAIASLLMKQISLGDPLRLNFLLDRLVGPVKSTVELTGPEGEPLAPVVAMSSQELTVTLIAIQKIMKEKEWNSAQSLPPSPASAPASSRRGSRTAS